MQRSSPTFAFGTTTFVDIAVYPHPNGKLVRFYVRREFVVKHNGLVNIERTEFSGEAQFEGKVLEPSRPRRLYALVAEGVGLRGE